ncbi:hypothetical protein [Pseudomonas sp. 273]|uniref:hypothetical protein n=1 Tax=Pseudomonas TaxID=286 RepID=UPI0023D87E8F|nr:hypothetical protein [Pseudomonas sp. 273]
MLHELSSFFGFVLDAAHVQETGLARSGRSLHLPIEAPPWLGTNILYNVRYIDESMISNLRLSIAQLPFASNWLTLVLDLALVAAGSIEGTAENPSEGGD